MTQREAHELIEDGPPYKAAARYADLMKTMYSIFFFIELIPICAPMYFISLCIYYWIDKVNLISYLNFKV